jgi:hypothetical protein
MSATPTSQNQPLRCGDDGGDVSAYKRLRP